jgi:hypothetical protein
VLLAVESEVPRSTLGVAELVRLSGQLGGETSVVLIVGSMSFPTGGSRRAKVRDGDGMWFGLWGRQSAHELPVASSSSPKGSTRATRVFTTVVKATTIDKPCGGETTSVQSQAAIHLRSASMRWN